MKFGEIIKGISYDAALQIMEQDGFGYKYIFSKYDLIRRGTIEKFYPELLERELGYGLHGEGFRDGIYVYLKGNE